MHRTRAIASDVPTQLPTELAKHITYVIYELITF